MRCSLFFFFAVFFLPLTLWGHAGCHQAPGAHIAPHGGVIEHTSFHLVELVSDTDPMEIYLLDADSHPLSTEKIQLTARIQTPPHSRGSASITLSKQKDHYLAKVTLQGSLHRYTLVLEIEQDQHKEQIEFLVEAR